ncbi:hypothetical protein CPB97_002771, partial [Podila verticillata]
VGFWDPDVMISLMDSSKHTLRHVNLETSADVKASSSFETLNCIPGTLTELRQLKLDAGSRAAEVGNKFREIISDRLEMLPALREVTLGTLMATPNSSSIEVFEAIISEPIKTLSALKELTWGEISSKYTEIKATHTSD